MATIAPGAAAPATSRIGTALPDSTVDRRRSRLFVHLALISCLCLQRFGLVIGGGTIFFSLPLFLALIGLMLVSGYGRIRMVPLFVFGLFALEGLIATLVAINVPETRQQLSILSLFSLLSIYLCLLVGPSGRFNRDDVIDIFLFYVRLCAVLGIAQYLLQFVGVRIFSFMLTFPALNPILIESLYNYNPILSYGSSIIRSNGFFLIEPSVFSQLLALGMAVEFFLKRQLKYLPLYAVAYLFSFSGTGLLALGLSIGILMLADRRYTVRVLLFVLALAALATIAAFVFPDQFASLAGRAGEASYSGSSGYARYFAQFEFIGQYTDKTRSLIGFGPGSMERSGFFFTGSGNPALKLFIDYGIIGSILFATFMVISCWRRDIAIISIFCLVNFQMGGGNLLFPPLIILIAILCVWSGDPDQAAARQGSALNHPKSRAARSSAPIRPVSTTQ
ncbi:hypothetical protein ACFB49_34330 [Sphingomonas sp. DBB INV C78]|uniref:hypothetical protein n=1 Tax=Sphingomonas sp. DBB INV C78 TaxID=3349434 RepID=UPI0036D3F6C7